MEDDDRSSRPLEANDSGNNIAAEETLHDRLLLSCPHCNQSFSDRADLKKHIKCSHPEVIEKPHLCDACPIAFQYPSQLKQHVRHVHSPNEPPECPKCGCKCKTANNLKQHLKTHEDNRKKFKCSKYGKDYLRKGDLDRHWRDAHACLKNEGNAESDNSQANNEEGLGSVQTPADQPLPYSCQQCVNSFSTQNGLRQHITCQHPELNKKRHQCQVCHKSFPTPSKLMRHSGQVHNEDWPYGCSKCTFRCKTEWVLQSHLKIHDQNDGTIKCSICAKEYFSNVGLNYHLKTAHDSLSNKANAENDNSQDNRDEEKSQGEASGVVGEAALGHCLKDAGMSFENGIGTVDHPTTGPQPRLETMKNAAPLAGRVCFSYFLQEVQNEHWKENPKSDGAIEKAVTATENAPGVTSQGVSLSLPSTHDVMFTASNPTPGPSNAQREASCGIAKACPKLRVSTAASQGVQNGLIAADYHPSARTACIESQTTETEFPLAVWDCHCGNMYASHDDLRKHCDEDHKLDCRIV